MANKTEVKYQNIWTKLHLGPVRGNKLFKGVWRAARVGIVTAVLFFVQKVLPGLDLIPVQFVPVIATGIEKLLRELFPAVDF